MIDYLEKSITTEKQEIKLCEDELKDNPKSALGVILPNKIARLNRLQNRLKLMEQRINSTTKE